jgi:hypothetical protein
MPINTVLNIAALRALSISGVADGDVVYVAHHSLSIDQGGGEFIWESTFVGTGSDATFNITTIDKFDNNGTFIKPNSITAPAPGRWRRIESVNTPNVMKADWFGAISNGSTTDSRAAIQAAFDSLPLGNFNLPQDATGKTPSGRFIRVGTVELSGGTYYLGGTIYLTCYSRIRGQGKQISNLSALTGAFPLGNGEKFMVQFERPSSISDNNSFSTICENLSIAGNQAFNNGGVSALSIFGAQGSWVKDVNIIEVGIRGLEARGIPILGSCWFANCNRGPMLDFSGGPGTLSGNLSIEHVNQGGINIDPDTNLPYAALSIKNADLAHFDQLQFEGGPVDISIVNSRSITIRRLITNVGTPPSQLVNGFPTYGVYIKGDSYSNVIPRWWNLGGVPHARPYWDDSAIAQQLNQVGKILPLYPTASQPAFNITASATQSGSSVPTTVVRKSESLGWYVNSAASLTPQSQCVIEISGSPREWSGMFLSFDGLYGANTATPGVQLHPFNQAGGILGKITVARTTENGASGRISKAIVTGKGTHLTVIPDNDVTFGATPPPEVQFTVVNSGNGNPLGVSKIVATAVNDSNSGSKFSVNLEIL